MRTPAFLQRVSAPHETRRFWLLAALGLLIPVAANLWLVFRGLPPFPLRVQLISGGITVPLWITTIWLALRFGPIVSFIVAALLLGFGLLAESFPL